MGSPPPPSPAARGIFQPHIRLTRTSFNGVTQPFGLFLNGLKTGDGHNRGGGVPFSSPHPPHPLL